MKNIRPETQDNSHLTALFQEAYPAPAPSESLQIRVAALPVTPAPRQFRLPRLWSWQAGFAAAGVLLATIGVAVVRPENGLQAYAQRIEKAVVAARTQHIQAWAIVNGKSVLQSEAWAKDGKNFNRVRNGFTSLLRDGKAYSYDKKRNTLTINKIPLFHSTLTFTELLKMQQSKLGQKGDAMTELPQTQKDGQTVRVFALLSPPRHTESIHLTDAPRRSVYYVHASNDLPLRIEWQQRMGKGEWRTYMWTKHEYNIPIPDSLFEANFPKDVKILFDDFAPKK